MIKILRRASQVDTQNNSETFLPVSTNLQEQSWACVLGALAPGGLTDLPPSMVASAFLKKEACATHSSLSRDTCLHLTGRASSTGLRNSNMSPIRTHLDVPVRTSSTMGGSNIRNCRGSCSQCASPFTSLYDSNVHKTTLKTEVQHHWGK